MFWREDTLDDLHQELGQARRELATSERAPFEHRVCDPDAHALKLERLRENVRELEREISLWHADNQQAEDLSLTVGYDEYLGGRA